MILHLSGKHSLEACYEFFCFGYGKRERRQQAYDVRAAYAGKDMLLEEQLAAYVLYGLVELHTYHQALTADLLYTLNL